jgi:putative copper resistance protein D
MNENQIASNDRKYNIIAILFILLTCTAGAFAWFHVHNMPDMQDMSNMPGMENMPGMDHGHMNMPAPPEDPAAAALRLADQRGSEFNHHVAGFLLVLAGIVVLLEDPIAKRWTPVRYVWPMCFLVAGVLLLIFSDPEVWPIGPETWSYVLSHNIEATQHKAFSLILLILGYVEFERARGRFRAMWTGFIFPTVALAGAILLTFHVHGGSMNAPGAMERMKLIQREHGWFTATGFGIALTKGLAVLPLRLQPVLKKVWPALMVVLGCLLMIYTE